MESTVGRMVEIAVRHAAAILDDWHRAKPMASQSLVQDPEPREAGG
jgi:hypothetical protein